MLDLRRGFRRLLLVLSVVWIVGSGFFLWQSTPPPPSHPEYLSTDPNAGEPIPLEYDAEGRPIYDAEGNPVTGTSDSDGNTHIVYAGKHYVLPGKLSADEALRRVKDVPTPRSTRQPIEALWPWLEIGFIPPVIVFALFEGLAWALSGFRKS